MPRGKKQPGEAPVPVEVGDIALGSTYAHDDAVGDVVRTVLSKWPEKFRHLRSLAIASLRRESRASDDAFAVDKAGGAFVRADRERGVSSEYDVGVWFRGRFWDQMTPEQRQAWAFHQLSHLQPTPKGDSIRKVGHDVEAFTDEGLIFGAWEASLTLWATNLDRHERGEAPTPDVPKRVVAATDDDGRTTGYQPTH